MNTQIILQIMLTLHLVALAVTIGIALVSVVLHRQFWKLYDNNTGQSIAAFKATLKLRIYGIMGLGILILTGVMMLWLFNWTMAELLWFKIKMFIVVLLFVNGFTIGKTTSEKLEKILNSENRIDKVQHETIRLRKRMRIFQLTQLSLFILIIILAIFRFS